MKRITTIIAAVVAALSAQAQNWVYSEEFGTDFLGAQTDFDVHDTQMQSGLDVNMAMQNTMRKAWQTRGQAYIGAGSTKVNANKIAAAVNAARPRTTSSSVSTSTKSRRVGNYNYNTTAEAAEWRRQRALERQEAARRAAEKKRLEAIQRKIADDNRAAAVTASTNARLQAETNRRMANDRYHAGAGAVAAQQRARRAVRYVGPNFSALTPQMTAEEKAGILRRRAKPRRTMAAARNQTRQRFAPVKRAAATEAQLARRAQWLKTAQEQRRKEREEQRKRYMASKMVNEKDNLKRLQKDEVLVNKAFVLGPHAHSTLGRDWGNGGPSLTPPPVPKYPVDPATRRKNQEFMDLAIKEFFSN